MIVNFQEFRKQIIKLVVELSVYEFDCIVGLQRGGLVPAVCLSHKLKLPMVVADISHPDSVGDNVNEHDNIIPDLSKYNSILIVDDILDSGNTIKKAIEIFNDKEIYVCALFGKERAMKLIDKPCIVCEKIEDDSPFIDFPWEL